MDVRVTGAEQLAALAKDLRAAGDKELRRELMRGLQRAGKPMKAAARTAALTELPSRGGLAELVASSRWSVTTRSAGRGAGVRVAGRGLVNASGQELDLASLNRGRLRHPVYGRRGAWVNQRVKVGWFTDAMEVQADSTVRAEVLAAISAVRDKLGSGA